MDPQRDPIWRNGTLIYQRPDVPYEFELIEKPIRISLTGEKSIAGSDGRELFLRSYENGWQEVRRKFYLGYDWANDDAVFDFYDEYDLSKLRFRADWDHFAYSQYHGRTKCREQIRTLLTEFNEAELKRKIAYSPVWQCVPGAAMMLVGIIFLAKLQIPVRKSEI